MNARPNPQLNKNGELIHLLSPEGLPRDILTHIQTISLIDTV